MLKPRLVKQLESIEKANSIDIEKIDLAKSIIPKLSLWIIEIKLEKSSRNPKEEFRRLFKND